MAAADPGVTELTASECWAYLRAVDVGRLAVSADNRPDIFPINFVVHGDTIVFRTNNGTKLAAAVLGPAVAFEVDGYDRDGGVAWSVVVKGRASEVEGLHGLFAALQLPFFPWHAAPKNVFVRIEPEEITGRRFTAVDSSHWHVDPPATPLDGP